MDIAKYIDHTKLSPQATGEEIDALCDEAIKFGFKAICVNGCYVSRAAARLKGTGVLVAAVVGFPLGAGTSAAKAFETSEAVKNGADEIDMVINIGAIKAGDFEFAQKDILAVVKVAGNAKVKVIIECCLLNYEEKEKICKIAQDCHAALVKTSTGFSTGGATKEDVKLMKAAAPHLFVKAAGGIKTRAQALEMIEAGADRIGTSNGVSIING